METKKWWQSKTLWGIFVAIIGLVMQQLNVTEPTVPVNPDLDQISEYVDAIKASKGSWDKILGVVLQALGSLYAIWGRVKADTKIS